jgi:hypothetical protein
MRLPERIAVDPEIMMGKPCVKGTRSPVYVLLQKMAAAKVPKIVSDSQSALLLTERFCNTFYSKADFTFRRLNVKSGYDRKADLV